MQKVIKAIKDCVASKTCCEETGVNCNQGRDCPVREGTHKPAEAVHQIEEPTVNQQLTDGIDERAAFESWLGIKPCGAAHDLAWSTWKARAALAATHPPQQGMEPIEQRQLAIGQAVERACKELPEGAEIQIYLERGAGTVHMTDWDGNEFDHFDEAHEDFADRINAAIDGAIAAEQFAAQAKQGGV